MLNGSHFDKTKYPDLYTYLGSETLPDFQECAIVGIGNNITDSVITHDPYTLGQFKNDQMQDHKHQYLETRGSYKVTYTSIGGSDYAIGLQTGAYNESYQLNAGGFASGRYGDVTRGKRKGALICMKAL